MRKLFYQNIKKLDRLYHVPVYYFQLRIRSYSRYLFLLLSRKPDQPFVD